MVKNHLKALNAPKTWNVKRRQTKFVLRPMPGASSMSLGIPLGIILKDELKLTTKSKEARFLLTNKECLVDGKVVNDMNYIVGLFDVVSLPKIKKHYRLVISKEGLLQVVEIDDKESNVKISKIINKTILPKGKVQINTLDGRNIIVDNKKYNTSDSLLISFPQNKISGHISLEKGCTILLFGGKHLGTIGTLENVDGNKIFFSIENKTYETLKKFIFVLGKNKPEITVRK